VSEITDLLVRAARLEIERDEAIKARRSTEAAYRDLLAGRMENFTMFGLTSTEWLDIQSQHRRYEAALRKIASEDYRGNRPTPARLAFEALHPGGAA